MINVQLKARTNGVCNVQGTRNRNGPSLKLTKENERYYVFYVFVLVCSVCLFHSTVSLMFLGRDTFSHFIKSTTFQAIVHHERIDFSAFLIHFFYAEIFFFSSFLSQRSTAIHPYTLLTSLFFFLQHSHTYSCEIQVRAELQVFFGIRFSAKQSNRFHSSVFFSSSTSSSFCSWSPNTMVI